MGEVNRRQDPFNRINGDPPQGMSWSIVEHPTGDLRWLRESHRESTHVCSVHGPSPETEQERRIRLLSETADLTTKAMSRNSEPSDLLQIRANINAILKMEST